MSRSSFTNLSTRLLRSPRSPHAQGDDRASAVKLDSVYAAFDAAAPFALANRQPLGSRWLLGTALLLSALLALALAAWIGWSLTVVLAIALVTVALALARVERCLEQSRFDQRAATANPPSGFSKRSMPLHFRRSTARQDAFDYVRSNPG